MAANILEIAFRASVDDLKRVVEDNSPPVDVNQRGFDRRTALHIAAAEGHLAVVDYLLSRGADVNARDRWGRTPLDDARYSNFEEVAAVLIKRGGVTGAGGASGGAGAGTGAAGVAGTSSMPDIIAASGSQKSVSKAVPTSSLTTATTSTAAVVMDRTLHSALRHVLPLLSEKSRSEYVECWYATSADAREVVCTGLWYCEGSHIEKVVGVRRVSEDLRVAVDELPVPMRDALAHRQPQLIPSIESLGLRSRPGRLESLQAAGLRCGLALVPPVPPAVGWPVLLVLMSFVPPPGPLPDAAALDGFAQLAARALSSSVSGAGDASQKASSRSEEQKKEVQQLIVQEGTFNPALVLEEVEYFFGGLGLSEYYFAHFPPHVVAKHVHTFIAAKQFAAVNGNTEDIRINTDADDSDFYMCPNRYEYTIKIDKKIEKSLEGVADPAGTLRRLTFMTSSGPAVPTGETRMVLYFLDQVPFTTRDQDVVTAAASAAAGETATQAAASGSAPTNPSAVPSAASAPSVPPPTSAPVSIAGGGVPATASSPPSQLATSPAAAAAAESVHRTPSLEDIWSISTGKFLVSKSASVRERYSELLTKALGRLAPVIQWHEKDEGTSVMIAWRRDSSPGYFTAVSELLNFNSASCSKKFVEQFANGFIVMHISLDERPNELADFLNQISLMAVVPQTVVRPLLLGGVLSTNEMVYAYVMWRFAYYFLKPANEEYAMLYEALKDDPVNAGRLIRLRKVMQKEFLSESRIEETINKYPEVLKQLYADFATKFRPKQQQPPAPPSPVPAPAVKLLSRVGIGTGKGLVRVKTWRPTSEWDPRQIPSLIKKSATSELDEQILLCFLSFNQHLLKTNFFKGNKSALSFRLDPKFMAARDLRATPYGLFFVLGRDFRGFHVRFRDVARGGIRLVRSVSQQQHVRNKETLFDENYNLAFTQQMKNKDIPEGGSKGTVLPSFEMKANPEQCFKKYIDSLLDLLLPDADVVDYYGREEIIFCGPDEGTADYMDWAALHARARGARFWKAFTTGKSMSLGGIPHDLFGMTTRGIHEFKLGVLRKKGLDERRITKFQTGGPDGDLGSNEIRISSDRTVAVVDGSGVLYDPRGIDRDELLKLAKTRQMVCKCDRTKISPQGFLMLVEDRDVTLPDGTKVESGLSFRNEFHLTPYAAADLFVPCGGRPEAVNINNYQKLLERDGSPRFKYIVEGANLFFTQDARLALEKAGAIIFKDASANKGGVTSSSLEVLAALALSDEEYSANMMISSGHTPPFYTRYVEHVKQVIAANARLEFECLWTQHEQTGIARSILSDKISEKINELEAVVSKSPVLWNQLPLRKRVLTEALPKLLVDMLGLEKIMQRVPESYLRAIFGTYLAAHYVYKHGLNANEFAFFEFMCKYFNDFALH